MVGVEGKREEVRLDLSSGNAEVGARHLTDVPGLPLSVNQGQVGLLHRRWQVLK